MANFIKSIPRNEPKALVQSRIPKGHLDVLRANNVDVPELIRQAVADTVATISAAKKPRK